MVSHRKVREQIIGHENLAKKYFTYANPSISSMKKMRIYTKTWIFTTIGFILFYNSEHSI